jgi:hypothetical protein
MRTSTYTAWDRALGGDLTSILATYKADGLPLDEITFRLRSDHDVKVSRSTVARWLAIAEHEVAS